MPYALIVNGVVVEVFGGEKRPQLHPSLQLQAIPAGLAVVPGWAFDGETFTKPPGEDLEARRSRQADAVRREFTRDQALPVQALGVQWNGGLESALRLDGARRLAELGGLDSVTFTDTANQEHLLDLADAAQVVLAVGEAYRLQFLLKQARLRDIAAAQSIEALEALA